MFIKVLKHELRNMTRDRMYVFFVFYEIILIVSAAFFLPYLEREAGELAMQIAMIVFLLMSGIVFGAITGFTILDDQDDGVMFSLKVTPMNVKYYIGLKLLSSFLFSAIGTLALLLMTGAYQGASILDFIMIIILSSLQAPFIALVMTSFASNKVEGFVYMKLTGLTLAGPILALFLTDASEFLLSIFPGFWPSRLLMMEMTDMTYSFDASWIYFVLGLICNVAIIYLFLKIFSKKHQLN